MSIATMEDLRAVSPGGGVIVHDRTFTREGDLFRWANSLVPAHFFTSEVEQGNVTRGPEFPAGQVRRDRNYDNWVVVREVEDQVWLAHVATTDSVNWTPDRFTSTTLEELRTYLMVPGNEWATAMLPGLVFALDLHLSRPETPPVVEPDTSAADDVRAALQTSLRTYIEEHDGLTSTERENLIEVMRDNGMAVTRNVNVTIEVTGRSSVYMDDAMAEAVGGDVSVDMPRVEVEWVRTFDHQVTTDSEPEEAITDALVASLLATAGVTTYDSFEYEVTY